MLSLRRKAVQAAPRLQARYASTHTNHTAIGSEGHPEAGSHEHHEHHHHEPPKPESLGTQFYVALAAVPVCIGVYSISRPTESGDPPLTRFIKSYSDWQERFAARNAVRTAALEQAAFDRHLFHSESGSKHIELRFPEVFNTGSPYNGVAGHQARGMDELVKHYQKLNADEEERKLKKLSEKEAS